MIGNKIYQLLSTIVTIIIIIIIILMVGLWVFYYTNPNYCTNYYNNKWYSKSNILMMEEASKDNFEFLEIENDYVNWKKLTINLEKLAIYKTNHSTQEGAFKSFFKTMFLESDKNNNETKNYKELCWKENDLIKIVTTENPSTNIKWLNSNKINKLLFLFVQSKSTFFPDNIAGCLVYILLLDGEKITLYLENEKKELKGNSGFIIRSDVKIELETGSKLLMLYFIPKSKTIWDRFNFPLAKIMHKTNNLKNKS